MPIAQSESYQKGTCVHLVMQLWSPQEHRAKYPRHSSQSEVGSLCQSSRAASGLVNPEVKASGHIQHLGLAAHQNLVVDVPWRYSGQ
jgi:hypothetical protein